MTTSDALIVGEDFISEHYFSTDAKANAVNFTVFAGQCLSSGKGVAAVMFWMTHYGLIQRR